MNDNTINSIISKTYFIIISLLIFIFVLFSSLFIILQHGFFIEKISLPNVQVKQLYIKWNEKIDVSVKEIHLDSTSSQSEKTKVDYSKLHDYILSFSYTQAWFHSVTIQNISYKDINASFLYKGKRDGYIYASSPDLNLSISLNYASDILNVHLKNLELKNKDIKVDGNIYIDTKNVKLYTKLNAQVTQEANLTILALSTEKKLQYKLKNNKKIKSIKKLIDLAGLSDTINYWAYDAITQMSYVSIAQLYGYIDYDDLESAYKNVYVKAIVHDVHYVYNPKLDSIQASSVELEFKDGLFYIRPINAYSYGIYLNKSTIKIDFTKEEVLLTLHLLFEGKLNKDVLGILEAYNIKLPFLQHSGGVDTDLSITIGLRDIDIKAKGTFYTKKANFDYLGLNIDIADANILLDGFQVSIDDMNASYLDIADASVDVRFDALKKSGTIGFEFSKVNFGNIQFYKEKEPLYAKYKINAKGDSIDIQPSIWNFKDQRVEVDATEIPFDINDTNISIPTTFVSVPEIGDAFVSGLFNIKSLDTLLDIDILHFAHSGIKLSQSNTPVKFSYTTKKIEIDSQDDIYFLLSGTKYKAKDFCLELVDDNILLKHTSFEIGKYITAKVYANYDVTNSKAHISLSNFILKDPNSDALLYKNSKMLLSASVNADTIEINSPELNANFKLKDSGWKLKLNSLDRISKNSKFLKSLQLHKGAFLLYKNNQDKFTYFKSKIEYPYKMLVEKNIPQSEYLFKGKIYKEKISMNINNQIDVTIKENININLKQSSVDINEVLRAIKEINVSNENNNSKAFNVLIHGEKSQLYVSDKRAILYDTLDIQYYNTVLTAQLEYKKGKAGLQLANNKFHVYGKEFNDKFMNRLFALSKFKNGTLDFSINGDIDNYTGVLYVNKTIIKKYKTLNNILAFINTVPSLVTFNVPGYAKEGLKVNKAYMMFTSADEKFNISDIYLNSKEIDILGKGTVDLKNSFIDLILNLKTDLGSDLAKVPLVGYVILGQDSISTTLSIKGDLANPKVKSLIAKDIIVAPLNIIKRTLLYPYKLLKKKKTHK